MSKETAESEEQKFIGKIKDLKRRIVEVEQSNEIAMLAINRTKSSIRRARLEYSILLERLEAKALDLPEEFDIDVLSPPSPNYDPQQQSPHKPKKERKLIRDPKLPKRPTNAYLIFCEKEKVRLKNISSDNSLASVLDLGKVLVENWKNLPEEEKKKYHQLYEIDKERFKQQMAEYNKRNGINEVSNNNAPMDGEELEVNDTDIVVGENADEDEDVEEENDDSMELDPRSEPPEVLVDPNPELESEIDPEIKQEMLDS